jgi:hypothetical protein
MEDTNKQTFGKYSRKANKLKKAPKKVNMSNESEDQVMLVSQSDASTLNEDWASLTKAQRRNRHKKEMQKQTKQQKKQQNLETEEQKQQQGIEKRELKRKRLEEQEGDNYVPVPAHQKQKTDINNKDDDDIDVGEERVIYPYEVDSADHCETPTCAYEDICPILDAIAKKLNKTRETLYIYDPYYCEGSMRERLQSLGYKNIYNKKEDFYNIIENKQCPNYDVLVTNPPYSEPHVPRLLEYVATSNKPFLLLMPNYFYMKDYYYPCLQPGVTRENLFYISPEVRYAYHTPKGRRQKKSSKFTAPFPSFWYCHLAAVKVDTSISKLAGHEIYQKLANNNDNNNNANSKRVVNFSVNVDELPIAVLPETDPRKRVEINDRKREKHKLRKIQKQQQQQQ